MRVVLGRLKSSQESHVERAPAGEGKLTQPLATFLPSPLQTLISAQNKFERATVTSGDPGIIGELSARDDTTLLCPADSAHTAYFAFSKHPTFNNTTEVTILHFNDVYNIKPTEVEPVGGAARFCFLLRSFKSLEPLVLFSGDVFSPDVLSSFTKGAQMTAVLNRCGVHSAVFGNHDFDFGFGLLKQRVSESQFPWLLSNVFYKGTNDSIATSHRVQIIERSGIKIGLIGLIEQKWLDTQLFVDPDQMVYFDFVQVCKELATHLLSQDCDYIIALTHMRWANDVRLAEECLAVDLILGGHDHEYKIIKVGEKNIVKSGTDFKQLSKITLQFRGISKAEVNIQQVNVTSDIEEDQPLNQDLTRYSEILKRKGNTQLFELPEMLDTRADVMGRAETGLGSWLCDAVLGTTQADLVLLNGGTFRADKLFPAGSFTEQDLVAILPTLRGITILNVTGQTILEALENGVSRYPRASGRFLQVAGLRFIFDPHRPAGQRVLPHWITVGGRVLEPSTYYRLATRVYLHRGYDGYTMLRGAQQLMDKGVCTTLQMIAETYIQTAQQITDNWLQFYFLSSSYFRAHMCTNGGGGSLRLCPKTDGRTVVSYNQR